MHIDLQASSPGDTFRSTVCVVGGGIAGLMLSLRLAHRGIAVHLLEAGGLLQEERSQALYRAGMAGQQHNGTREGRFRTFGGSSTRWGGQLLPFTQDIFQPPPGAPSEAWPISEGEISPFYAEIQRVLGVDSLPFTADLLPALGQSAAPVSPDVILRFSKWIPFAARNLAATLGAEALTHPLVTVFSHSNAVELVPADDDPGRVALVQAVDYDRRVFHFAAEHFVLCAGTIESSRLLLCSPGVPNPHDQVGRYFHDHVSYPAAKFISPGRERAIELLGPYYVNGTMHSAKLEASPELRARQGLLNVMAHMVIQEPEDSGVGAVRNLVRSLQSRKLRQAFVANLLPVLRGAGDVVRLWFYSRFKRRRAVSKQAAVLLHIDVEQAPHAGNRIRLSPHETDALGMPRAVVDWHVGQPELDTAARYVPVVKEYLQSCGIDTFEWQTGSPAMADTYHMMGGLRMGTDPAASVVDPGLKVHGLSNLYVASCAVFPSGSSSNPTFTLMALTLRLADRLAQHCQPQQAPAAAAPVPQP